jgi:acyl-CoA synthetase (AMP-forming)/AMP-acid ligase II
VFGDDELGAGLDHPCVAEAAELDPFCCRHLASYKVPRIWRFVDQFPQTASGKIQTFLLREQLSPGRTVLAAEGVNDLERTPPSRAQSSSRTVKR